MTRHQRRKAAKAIREAKARDAIVKANLSQPQAKRPVSRIAADYAKATGYRLDPLTRHGGLHRNNAVPQKHRTVALMTTPDREALVRLRVAPFYRDNIKIAVAKGETTKASGNRPTERIKGKLRWNLDSFVDNRALRTKGGGK